MSNIDLLKESPLYPLLVKDAEKDMRRSTVELVLEGRFGPLSDNLVATLKSASESKLKAVARHAGTETLAQLRKRLGLA